MNTHFALNLQMAGRIFKNIQDCQPELFNKIHPIQADFNATDLNITLNDRKQLLENVQIIFNVVASVKFNEKLSDAIDINVLGTKKILDLVMEMKNLKSFLHVSTLYSNCNRKTINEIVYEPEIGYEKLLQIFRILKDSSYLEKLEHCLIGEMPNTYTMTKRYSENLVNHRAFHLPAGIFRPPIIISTYKEPFPGWTDNLYGPSGLCTWAAKGYIHCFYGNRRKKANLIPADYCINAMIACAWDISRRYKIRKCVQSEIPVYNYIFENNNLTWGKYMDMARKGLHQPFDKALWYFTYFIVPSRPLYRLITLLFHDIPGYILDLIAATTGRKKIYTKGYQKIAKVLDMMSYFGLKEWKFTNNNILELHNQLKGYEKENFKFHINYIDWNEYFHNYLDGIKKFVLKEPNDKSIQNKKRYWRLYCMHQFTKLSFVFMLWMSIYKLFVKFCKKYIKYISW